MPNTFVPSVKNPPAKVKDSGIIELVLAGAGVYNAKSSDLLLLPEGHALLSEMRGALFASLLEEAAFQPVDCMGSDSSVLSLAERYVREYGDQALLWTQSEGRDFSLHGWQSDEERAVQTAERVMDAIRTLFVSRLTNLSFVTKVLPGKVRTWQIAAESDGASVHMGSGYRCLSCGATYHSDSCYESKDAPVNGGAEEEPVADVHTPGTHTIQLLCEYLNIPIETTLKAMLYTLELQGGERKLLFAMIRGDRDISIPKLSAWVEANYPGAAFRRAENMEIVESFGEVAGFCGPVGVPGQVQMVADVSLKDGKNFVVGGNRPDYHKTGCCWGRDFQPPLADLALFHEGLPCPSCGGALKEIQLRILGEIDIYRADTAGEDILSCRDRDGQHEWRYRVRGKVALEALLLSAYERHLQSTSE